MNNSRFWLSCIISVLIVILFENCKYDNQKFNTSKAKDSQTSSHLENGGQPYDGKPFINSDEVCLDHNVISSRILFNNGNAFIVRENCKDIPPRPIKIDSIEEANSEQKSVLNYNGITFVKELGPMQIPLFTPFYAQLTNALSLFTSPKVYIVDLFETSDSDIFDLKNKGIKVVCSFSAGTWEKWRPDALDFPPSVLGLANETPSERYLDIRSAEVRSIMLKRLDLARQKGCLGVDMDNMDGYNNNSGFNITPQLQVEYNSILAYAAHDRNLFAGFHNSAEIVSTLVNSFDFAFVEQCFSYNECDQFLPFPINNKPIFVAEYTTYNSTYCSLAKTLGISLSFLSSNLDGSFYESCD